MDLIKLRTAEAGVSLDFAGEVRCETGFDMARGQWNAGRVLSACLANEQPIQKLREDMTNSFVLILTGRDLYEGSLNFVFGLARNDLKAAIVSWHRLATGNFSLFAERIAKEIVHEAGHMKGLDHCPKPHCVMWFSNTLQETDFKGLQFCISCAARLR